ncbi:MAG: hypothetical protein ACOCRK_03710 [bacterium]
MDKFLVAVKQEYVRDIQISPIVNKNNDNWRDAFGQIIIGVLEATDITIAIEEAASLIDVEIEILEAYRLA